MNVKDPSIIEEMTGTIDFLPTCSRCGAFVDGRVDVRQRLSGFPDRDHSYKTIDYCITPLSCSVCGGRFTAVRMPTKLPFEGM